MVPTLVENSVFFCVLVMVMTEFHQPIRCIDYFVCVYQHSIYTNLCMYIVLHTYSIQYSDISTPGPTRSCALVNLTCALVNLTCALVIAFHHQC